MEMTILFSFDEEVKKHLFWGMKNGSVFCVEILFPERKKEADFR